MTILKTFQRDHARWMRCARTELDAARRNTFMGEKYVADCKRYAREFIQQAADARAEYIAETRGFQVSVGLFGDWDRRYTWSCVEDGYDGDEDSRCPVGWGATRADAIRDLLWHIEEEA